MSKETGTSPFAVDPSAHLGLAGRVARQFDGATMEFEDRFGWACAGLVKAAKAFDPGKGKWTTFAGTLMRNEILMALRRERRHTVPTVSLDNPIQDTEDGSLSFADLIGAEEPSFAAIETALDALPALARLHPRERQVIVLRAAGLLDEEAAARMGISRSYVSRIRLVAREKLARLMGAAS